MRVSQDCSPSIPGIGKVCVRSVTRSCPTLCDPTDYSPPGSFVHRIIQAKIEKWVAISSSRASSQHRPKDGTAVQTSFQMEISFINVNLTHRRDMLTWVSEIIMCPLLKKINQSQIILKVKVKVTQSCPTLCDPMGYTVHGIFQARILKWVAFPLSKGSSQPRDQTQVSHIASGFFTS